MDLAKTLFAPTYIERLEAVRPNLWPIELSFRTSVYWEARGEHL